MSSDPLQAPDREFPRPHWLDQSQAVWPLLAIANRERSTLTAEAAQAMLADWGELLGMVGEYVFRAQRAQRALEVERGGKGSLTDDDH